MVSRCITIALELRLGLYHRADSTAENGHLRCPIKELRYPILVTHSITMAVAAMAVITEIQATIF